MNKAIKVICLFISISILCIACEPMAYTDLSGTSNSLPINRDEYVLEAVDDGDFIEVRFQIIPEAQVYGYGTSSKNVISFNKTDLTFSDGYYTARIDKSSDVFTPAASSSVRKASAGKLTVLIFASPDTSLSDGWIFVKSIDVSLSLNNAPNLSFSARKKDSVVLSDRSGSSNSELTYQVTVNGEKSIEFDASQLPYTLNGIGEEAVSLTVSHKYTGTDTYGELTQSIAIPAYDPRESDIGLTIESDGSVTVSDLPADSFKTIGLFSVAPDNSLSLIESLPYPTDNSSISFSSEVLGSGFYAGNIRAVVYNESTDEATALLSAIVPYEREIDRSNEKIGRQSYSISIPISEKLQLSSDMIKVSGATDSFSFENNCINISIPAGKLLSRSDYSVKISIDVPNYGAVVKDLKFTTESFEGNYVWSYGSLQFAVIVENAPAGSKYNYYVFTSPDDIAFKDTEYKKLRISPIFENDSELPSGGVAYSDAPEAYRWNNEKWNSSSYTPSTFNWVSSSINSKDSVSADTSSTAKAMGLSMEAVTTTSIDFKEKDDGTCILLFFNKITDGDGLAVSIGNGALRTNKNPQPSNFESSEYHYGLIRQEGN